MKLTTFTGTGSHPQLQRTSHQHRQQQQLSVSPCSCSFSTSRRSAPSSLHLGPTLTASYPVPQHRSASRLSAYVRDSEPWWDKGTAENMKSINSVEELVLELAAARDRLVIVDFYATWCHACKALYPKLCKLCVENPDIVFLKVNFDENKTICKALGVKVLPLFQLYRGAEGQVASFSASISKFQRLRDALALHGPARCSLGSSPTPDGLSNLMQPLHGSNVVPGPHHREHQEAMQHELAAAM